MNEQDILEQMLSKLQTLLDLANQDSEYCKTNLREYLRPLANYSIKSKDELMQAIKAKFINSGKLQDVKNRIVSLIHYLNLAEETADQYESLKASFMEATKKRRRKNVHRKV